MAKKKAVKKGSVKDKGATKGSVRKATQAPDHELAPDGFTPQQYADLSTIVRVLSADGVVEASPGKKGAPKRAIDFNQIMALLAQYGPLIAALLASLTKKPEPPVVVTPPIPGPVPSPVTPPLVPPVPQPPPVTARRIAGGKSHILGVEGWSKKRGHYSLGGGTVRNIATGDEPCGAGYRIHLDSSPWDQNRLPFFNPDVKTYAALFAQDPSQVAIDPRSGSYSCGEGNNRINHFVTVDGVEYGPQGDMVPGTPWQAQEVVDLTSEYDDAACTPVLLVPYDIGLSEEHKVWYRAEHVAPDGTVTRFEPSPTFRVKAWGQD